jgi:outer membrane protein assembly factor BamB
MSLRSRKFVLLACLGLATSAATFASADEWPQWMGPRRDNVWREDGLIEAFPAGGPKVLWRTPVAGGYAGPAVAGGRVFVTDYVTDADVKVANFERKTSSGTERVLCLDAASGRQLWKHEYPVNYTISYPAGPRCTPTVDGDRVYTLGAEGDLCCLATADGRLLWSRDLKADYRTKAALWGWASHPLIDGDRLVCVVGTDVTHTVAFDKLTGKEIWRAGTAPEQGYSPPTIIEVAGKRQLVLMKPDGIYAVEPETGRLLWESPYNADNGSIIMAPVRVGDYLYVGGFQEKNLLLKLAADGSGVEVVWRNKPKHGISAVNVQPFVADGHVYGFHEKGDLRAIAIPGGDVVWKGGGPLGDRPQGSGTAFIVKQGDAQGGRYWMFAETGDLVIANMSPQGYTELGRAHLLEPTNTAFGRNVVWCVPAYADRSIFVRNDEEIIRVSLAR